MSRTVKSTLFFGIGWLLCFTNALADEPFFTKEESLYSYRTGTYLTDLVFSVSSQSDNPDEYVLSISNAKSSNTKSIWIFGQRMSAELLIKSDPSIKVKDIDEFSVFCENRDVRFKLAKWGKIKTSLKVPFFTTASEGDKIKLRLRFYISSQDKKKTIIEDEANVRFEFSLPSQAGESADKQTEQITTLPLDLSPGSVSPTPEEIEAKAKQKEDSLKQVKIKELDFFISKKNAEINAIYQTVVSNEKIEKDKLDSFVTTVTELKKKVDIRESGNVDLIDTDEKLTNQFAEFSTKHAEVLKEIEKRKAGEINWPMYIGIGMGILMLGGMLFMQIWNPIKLKRQQKKQQQEQQKLLEEQEKQRVLAGIDINDLDEI